MMWRRPRRRVAGCNAVAAVVWAAAGATATAELSAEVKTGADITLLNASVGGALLAIPRLPCSEAPLLHNRTEPLLLEGCCWLGRDTTGEESGCLPPIRWNHASLSAACGAQDVSTQLALRTLAFLESLPSADIDSWDAQMRRNFNVSLEEVMRQYRRPWTFDAYAAESHAYERHTLPDHLAGYVFPLSLKNFIATECPTLDAELATLEYPLPEFYRLPNGSSLRSGVRQYVWDRLTKMYIAPRFSFAHPTHVHGGKEAIAAVLLEGRKVWQLVDWTRESHLALRPYVGAETELKNDVGYFRAPVEVAREHRVYIGEQRAGDVLYMPRNQVHLVYNLEDTVSVNLLGGVPNLKSATQKVAEEEARMAKASASAKIEGREEM